MRLLYNRYVMSDSLRPHGLQHTRLPWLSLSPRVCSNVRWVDDAIQSSHLLCPPFSCPHSFPASGSFPVSCLLTSGGQSIGASASALVLPVNIQGWFPLGLTDLISLLSKGLSKVFLSTVIQNHKFFGSQPFLLSNSVICTWLLEKP